MRMYEDHLYINFDKTSASMPSRSKSGSASQSESVMLVDKKHRKTKACILNETNVDGEEQHGFLEVRVKVKAYATVQWTVNTPLAQSLTGVFVWTPEYGEKSLKFLE